MTVRLGPTLAALVAALGATAGVASSSGNAVATQSLPGLATAVVDPVAFGGDDDRAAFANVRRAGARFVRLTLDWSVVAPSGEVKPPGFAPRRADDPMYRWEGIDRQIRDAVAAGLTPIVTVFGAPRWAEGAVDVKRPQDGSYRPSYRELGHFATALARRYSGGFGGLPRVRHWQVWNEPNFSYYLVPQEVDGKLVAAGWYRAMVNSLAAAVRAVREDNLVVAGGLAPYGATTETLDGTSPLRFMRTLLCMSAGPAPKRTCAQKASFDVWSHHPYTSGGPTRDAGRPDDVSIGDLDEMNTLLRAAERAGAIRSSRRVRFWVTEFSWDTAPPDPKGVPMKLHARWVSEALYRMWRDGVSLVTWFLVRDEPFPAVSTQSGLFFRGAGGVATDRPKPSLQAFRFPFVAFRRADGTVSFWGRTPESGATDVTIERSVEDGWRVVARLRAQRSGVFAGRFDGVGRSASVRARVTGGEAAVPFSLRVPPDRGVCPFGTC